MVSENNKKMKRINIFNNKIEFIIKKHIDRKKQYNYGYTIPDIHRGS
jgi:hypothetical protein